LQVLPHSQHVHVVRAQVAHGGEHFVVGFAQTQHQAGLRNCVGAVLFERA
jgi:hypothetical protein